MPCRPAKHSRAAGRGHSLLAVDARSRALNLKQHAQNQYTYLECILLVSRFLFTIICLSSLHQPSQDKKRSSDVQTTCLFEQTSTWSYKNLGALCDLPLVDDAAVGEDARHFAVGAHATSERGGPEAEALAAANQDVEVVVEVVVQARGGACIVVWTIESLPKVIPQCLCDLCSLVKTVRGPKFRCTPRHRMACLSV